MVLLGLLAPRRALKFHPTQLPWRVTTQARRCLSDLHPKPRVLEKPERFNPPSHPARIRSKPRYYGPELSVSQKNEQKTRQYPHTMPPKGTFLHWFLTSRSIHLVITMGTLLTLVFGMWFQDFYYTTPYLDLLPPNSMLFSHPIHFINRWFEVYAMHVQYVSEKTAQRRKRMVDDVEKRNEYRKAHGLDAENETEKSTPQLISVPRASSDNLTHSTSFKQTSLNAAADYKSKEVDLQPERKKGFGLW